MLAFGLQGVLGSTVMAAGMGHLQKTASDAASALQHLKQIDSVALPDAQVVAINSAGVLGTCLLIDYSSITATSASDWDQKVLHMAAQLMSQLADGSPWSFTVGSCEHKDSVLCLGAGMPRQKVAMAPALLFV